MTDEQKRDFGRRLQRLLDQKGMIQSNLARLVFGTRTTLQGYTVPRGRDRISNYCAGKTWPRPHIMKKIADGLGVQIIDLAPTYGAPADKEPEWSVTKVNGQDKVFLRINKLLPELVAVEIARLLMEGA
jgi:transcriptional regulator with XRE-family HTH domain